jgi:virulence-associated protein VapD
VEEHHPRGSRQACLDVETALKKLGFERVQGSVFASKDDNLANLFQAINAFTAIIEEMRN